MSSRIEEPWEYQCHLCGWEFMTINGLWSHIPTHPLDQAMYGTLARVAALEAQVRAGEALAEAFSRHRTATHVVTPMLCVTCQESEAALAAYRAAADPASHQRAGTKE